MQLASFSDFHEVRTYVWLYTWPGYDLAASHSDYTSLYKSENEESGLYLESASSVAEFAPWYHSVAVVRDCFWKFCCQVVWLTVVRSSCVFRGKGVQDV